MLSLLQTSGPVSLADHDSRATPGLPGKHDDKEHVASLTQALETRLADAQEQLFASGRAETTHRKVLLVLQGMDTSGKGGVVRKVAGLVYPQGVSIASFKTPTPEELKHDFLWRIAKRLPEPGIVGVFDRSHYEDVLIGRVRALASAEEIERRYDAINRFEADFVAGGGVLLKCFLHISADDQAERLAERLADPTKYWKYNPGDIDERELWPQYQEAYEVALERCSTEVAPWHIVPSGRKWYRNWAIASMLSQTLDSLGLGWPPADFDIETEKQRLADSKV